MNVERCKSEGERAELVSHIGPLWLERAVTLTARMNREVFYPIEDPGMVHGAEAEHMRDEDQVIGIEHNGHAKAYPWFVVDYYHQINDIIGGEPIVVNT